MHLGASHSHRSRQNHCLIQPRGALPHLLESNMLIEHNGWIIEIPDNAEGEDK